MSEPYAVILAGGSGTRFWPLSRNSKPKQLLKLFDNESLLEHALRRLEGLVRPENTFILTNALQLDAVRALAPGLPVGNIVAEPARRDTAPAVALGIGLVAARDPGATMLVIPADQLIRDTAAFQSVMRDALAIASETDALVTLGIRPTWACPSYGYIQRGKPAAIPSVEVEHIPYEVEQFREKPSPELAAQFLAEGRFTWNAGMFIWSVSTALAELQTHAPELATFIQDLQSSQDIPATLEARFPELTPISIDFALMEKAAHVFNIEATFDWDDVGSWISIGKYLPTDDENNQSNEDITVIDSKNNIIFSDQKDCRIALLGVEDLIVVQTKDGLLVAKRHQADAIKKVVSLLPEGLL